MAAAVTELAKLVACVALGSAAGFGAGTGLAEVTGAADSGPPLVAQDAVREASAGEVRVQVLSAVLLPATTRSGRSRRRARLTLRVRLTNASSTRLAASDPVFISGGKRIRADPAAEAAAGALLAPLDAGASATGELRFEAAGAVTRRLRSRRRGWLRIGGESVGVRVRTS